MKSSTCVSAQVSQNPSEGFESVNENMVEFILQKFPMRQAMNKIDYDNDQFRNYAVGRSHPAATLQRWIDRIAAHVHGDRVDTIADIGAGTGRFSTRLADAFGARVIGVEPSDRMRAVAAESTADPRVSYVKGEAGCIPLDDDCADLAFLSMVLHHITNPESCVRELYRILRPRGYVFIRNAFVERLDTIRYHEFFPGTRAIDAAWLPGIPETQQRFTAGGFEVLPGESITYEVDPSLDDYCRRIETRAVSTFEHLADAEFEAGLRAMRQAAARERDPAPVHATLDLLVFRKPAPAPR